MYDIKKDTITVNDVEYRVNREPDRGSPEETLTLEIYDMEQDEFVDAFPGLSATLGYEEYIEEWMSPRDAANIGTISVSYPRYNLGDEDISKIDFEISCPNCDGTGNDPSDTWAVGIHSSAEYLAVGSQEDCQEFLDNLPDVESGMYYIEPFACKVCEGEQTVEVNPAEYFIKERGARVVIGLFVYEHSGITMSAGPRVGEVLKPVTFARLAASSVTTPDGTPRSSASSTTRPRLSRSAWATTLLTSRSKRLCAPRSACTPAISKAT